MRASRWFCALMALLMLTAAACGDDDDDGGEESTGPVDSTELADLSGQTVEVAAVWSGTEQERFQAVLDRFEELTGASTRFTSTGDDIAAVLAPRITAGDAPDVAMLPQPGLMRDFASQGVLQSIEEVAGDLIDENYGSSWRDLGTIDDTLYGLGFKAANKSTVWYNMHVFEDAGAETPSDWDGFIETAQTISDSGTPAVSVGGADGWTLTDWFENIYLRQAGPEKYDQLSTHDIPWTDQSVKDALTTLGQLFSKTDLIAGGPSGALQTTFDQSVTDVFADPPKAGIVYEGDFVAGVITGDTDAEIGTDAGFFDFPQVAGNGGVVGGGDMAVLMSDSEAGQELMKFLASPEAAEVWVEQGGFLSPNKNVDTSKYPDDTTREIAEALVSAETFRFDMSDLQPSAFGGTAGQGMWKLLQDFLSNPSDVEGIAASLEASAAQAFAG